MSLAPRFRTPYYVHGRSAAQWHGHRAENAAVKTVALAATGAALIHHPTRDVARSFAASHGAHVSSEHAGTAGKIALGAAGVTAGYAGYHEYKRHKFAKQAKQKQLRRFN